MLRLEEFVIAEDVRTEAGGLATIVGFMPGGGLSLSGPGKLPLLSWIAVLSGMTGVAGFEYQWVLRHRQDVLFRTERRHGERQPDTDIHSITQRVYGQVFPGPGPYSITLLVEVGGRRSSFSKSFTVAMARQSRPPADPSTH